jgi:hypothetical protein
MWISVKDGVWPSMDIPNSRREIAALRRCLANGKTLNDIRSDYASLDSPFSKSGKSTILLERDQEYWQTTMHKRIKQFSIWGWWMR